MYLLILTDPPYGINYQSKFTFHNVSINSENKYKRLGYMIVFTFHNVSINSLLLLFASTMQINLHSIMYLLILYELTDEAKKQGNLHSIMYLLIHRGKRCNKIS